MKGNVMWYVKLNDTILPTPYQYFSDCLEECTKLQWEMVAVCTEPVFIG
jgi:hypothetical protein